jgi:hypothetical protein
VLITRSGSVTAASAPSPFSTKIVQRLDPDAMVDAATAMERLREATADLEARAQRRHADAVAAAARKRDDDALREVDEVAQAQQRRAEAEMRRELAEQEAKSGTRTPPPWRALRRP